MNKDPHILSLNETPGHPQTVAVFENLAKGFKVPIEEEHTRYWRSMLTVGRVIDSLVDTHHPDSIEKEATELVSGRPVEGITELEALEFSEIYHSVSDDRKAAIRQGLDINDYAIAMRQADTFEQFYTLRVEEAEIFGNVMRLDNPHQQTPIQNFNGWLPKFARAGYLVDSFGDFSIDYKDGVIGLEPNLPRRLKLGKRALSEVFSAGSELPPRTIGFLALASVSKMSRNGLRKK